MTRLLVVDDKEENLYLLRALLTGHHYEVEEARHGAEALSKARQALPDLIISDLLMPVMDGYTLLRHWKSDERLRQVPFVVYTATYTDAKDEQLALCLGADAFIIKPVEPEQFMARIREVLVQRRDGLLSPTKLPTGDEQVRLREYSESLIRKLEKRALQLEEANHALKEDIAQRKRVEEALRKNEALLTEVGRIARIGGWEMDLVTRNASWTSGTRDVFEVEPGVPIPGPDDYADLYLPEYRPMIAEAMRALIEEDRPLDFEAEVPATDGHVKWCHVIGRAIREGDRCVKVHGTVQDITEHKRIEEALQRSTSLLRATLEATADGILAVDREGRIVAFNRKFTEMWRIPKLLMNETDDRLLFELVTDHLKDPDGFAEKVNALHSAPEEESWDIVEFKDGRIFERFSKPKRWGDVIDGRVWNFRDITERTKAETEWENLQAQFRQAQKMEAVGRLAGGVAHDFNNMLGIVLGYAELAKSRVSPNDPMCGELDQILQAAKRSAGLVRQLLAFARRQTVEPHVLNLNNVISQSEKMLQRLVGEEVAVRFVPGDDLWEVRIDPAQVDQILANLTVNARDAIPGVGKICIETRNVVLDEGYCVIHRGFTPGEYILLSFSDTGVGMDKDIQEHIFEPFFTTKEVSKGTGLGLSTIYGIVEQNKGLINVHSEVGLGTTFRIYIPRYMGQAEEQEKKPHVHSLTGTETILVAEDDRPILNLAQRILEKYGYTVIPAALPGEALVLCENHPGEIHLLITDVVLPTMTGKDLKERIEKIRPELKVLYMSGYTNDIIAHRGVLSEDVQFIQKPFSVNALVRKVREVLDLE